MHFHTPHVKKSEKKRKQSLDSVTTEDEAPALIDKKTAKSKKKAKTTKESKGKKDKAVIPDNTLIQCSQSSPTPSRETSVLSAPSPPVMSRADSALDIPSPAPLTTTTTSAITTSPPPDALRQTRTAPTEHAQPRRSSRIKNSMHSVANTWTKARPYLERINGTIMPLEPQGTGAYYARDGVKVD